VYKITLELKLKTNITQKESYQRVAAILRLFIKENTKDLYETHYSKQFSYYSFSNMYPCEDDRVYKKGNIYTVEVRTLKEEFLDLKKYKNLETDELVLLSANGGKLYYSSQGSIETETPLYMGNKRIKTKQDLANLQEKIRENIIFRYLKSGVNQSDDIDALRKELLDDENIEVSNSIVTIPFDSKRLNTGEALLYHCLYVKVKFNDNKLAKDVEKVIYAGGIGKNTSNGFGFIN